MKPRKAEIYLNELEITPVRIVADSAISGRGVMGGRLIPHVIIDTSNRPDIEEFILMHQKSTNFGDVKPQWGQIRRSKKTVVLLLKWERSSEITILIEFDIVTQGIIVDQALNGQGLYIQAGREGDRLIKNPACPKVLIPIDGSGFDEAWNVMWHKHFEKYFFMNGFTKRETRKVSKRSLKRHGRLW
jgi:hypothetical protein